MKNYYFLILILFICSCSPNNKNDLIRFDTNKSYPQKEIYLQDICEMDYIRIEDSVMITGRPRLITDSLIIYSNSEGELILYDMEGNFVRKFCHAGSGPGEYPYIGKVVYDSYAKLLIVSHNHEILYYTLEGEFIKSLSIDNQYFLWEIKDYNEQYLLCNNNLSLTSAYVFVSKKTGEIVDSINLKLKAPISPSISVEQNGMTFTYSAKYYNLVNAREGFLLSNISADTFYCLNKQKEIKPVLTRIPSIHEQATPILINAWIETVPYYFLSTVEKKYDPNTDEGFTQSYFMIEKEGQNIYVPKILNRDIEDSYIELDPLAIERTWDARKGILVLNAEELLEAYKKGKIKSQKLIDIVKNMKEDSNPVLMFMTFK